MHSLTHVSLEWARETTLYVKAQYRTISERVFIALCVHHVFPYSEEGEEPVINSHESAAVKTMIKGPANNKGKVWVSERLRA